MLIKCNVPPVWGCVSSKVISHLCRDRRCLINCEFTGSRLHPLTPGDKSWTWHWLFNILLTNAAQNNKKKKEKNYLTLGIFKSELSGLGWTLKLRLFWVFLWCLLCYFPWPNTDRSILLEEKKNKSRIFLITNVRWLKKASSHMKWL